MEILWCFLSHSTINKSMNGKWKYNGSALAIKNLNIIKTVWSIVYNKKDFNQPEQQQT